MTIDITECRTDEGANAIRKSEERRFRDPTIVDKVIALDSKWREAQFKAEQAKKEINAVNKTIAERKTASKGKDGCEDLIQQVDALKEQTASFKLEAEKLLQDRDQTLGKIGNVLHETVPVEKDEQYNEVVSTWGTPREFTETFRSNGFRPHYELVEMLGAVEFDAGIDVAGHRGYFLAGPGVLLNQALINFSLAFLTRRGYRPMQPPYLMRQEIMAQAAELADFDEVLYKIVESPEEPEKDKYLIATSEQPLTAFYRNKVLETTQIPIRFAGVSTCFRKEAGSSGRDIRGIFRVHQFDKIEQFCIVEKDKGWEEHENMIKIAQEFYQALEIPYRTVNIVSKEINNAAAKKYDLEGWFPGDDEGKGKYRELVSCSNCTEFQSRRMNTRVGFGVTQEFPHMLNSTLCATSRAICCLLENYQTDEGVRVPRALQPFMGGTEFLAFVRPPPKDKAPKEKPTKEKK